MPTFSVVWSSLTLGMRDEGPNISVGLSFENPVPITLSQIDGVEVYLALEGVNTVQFVMRKLALGAGLQDFVLSLDINFIAPLIDNSKVSFCPILVTYSFAFPSSRPNLLQYIAL